MINYPLIISTNYVGKQWSMLGNDYDALEWLDTAPKPTKAELDALWESTQTTVVAQEQATIDAKASALAKLAALGLTQDEVTALIG